jgi:hypothetical protein
MISQRNWRMIGIVCLVLALLLIIGSPRVTRTSVAVATLVLYWGAFSILIIAALYIALLDIRYTRMQYKMHERELFQETFMTEEFKKAVQKAVAEKDRENRNAKPS